MIRPPNIRQAMQTVQAFRREQRKARAPKIAPRAEGQRQPRQHDKPYLAWIRRQPCSAAHMGGCGGHIEAAHVRCAWPGKPITGMQRKPDDIYTVPLCADHHQWGANAQHRMGDERKWWAWVGKDPKAECERLRAEYEADK